MDTVKPNQWWVKLSGSIQISIISITAAVLVSDRYKQGVVDTLASVPPSCSVVPNLTVFHQGIGMSLQTALLSHLASHTLLFLLLCSVLLSCDSAAVRETHILLPTDAITDQGNEKLKRSLELMLYSDMKIDCLYKKKVSAVVSAICAWYQIGTEFCCSAHPLWWGFETTWFEYCSNFCLPLYKKEANDIGGSSSGTNCHSKSWWDDISRICTLNRHVVEAILEIR